MIFVLCVFLSCLLLRNVSRFVEPFRVTAHWNLLGEASHSLGGRDAKIGRCQKSWRAPYINAWHFICSYMNEWAREDKRSKTLVALLIFGSLFSLSKAWECCRACVDTRWTVESRTWLFKSFASVFLLIIQMIEPVINLTWVSVFWLRLCLLDAVCWMVFLQLRSFEAFWAPGILVDIQETRRVSGKTISIEPMPIYVPKFPRSIRVCCYKLTTCSKLGQLGDIHLPTWRSWCAWPSWLG